MAAYKIGTCSGCGREDVRVLNNGTVGLHNSYSGNDGVFTRCSGCGKPPVEQLLISRNLAPKPKES